MTHAHINQKGFTPVVLLLAVIIISVVGFGGYHVWRTQKPAATKTSSAIESKDSPALTNSLTVKEWGIKVALSGDENPYYVLYKAGQKDDHGSEVSQDVVSIYSTKFDNLKNSDGKQCKDIDDNENNPANYSNPPTKRTFLRMTRSAKGSLAGQTPQYAIQPVVTIGQYDYEVDTASLYGPGCGALWRGSNTTIQYDQNIMTAEQAILTSLKSDFKTLSAE